MGGSGGGSWNPLDRYGADELKEKLREIETKTQDAGFETQVADHLGGLLADANQRDATLGRERLDRALQVVGKHFEGDFSTVFGGSVSKRTYVEGLSDIDTLLPLEGTDLESASPQEALSKLENKLRKGLAGQAEVSKGRLAITLRYPDGMDVQLLPAKRTATGLEVPAWRGDRWSEIEPEGFRRALTQTNQACSGKLIPVIKLAKTINASLPESFQLSGYHLEAIGVAAFRGYSGAQLHGPMLMHYFERAREIVQRPIRDRTGQSIHVDDDLGPEGSQERQQTAHVLDRVYRRLRNAHGAQSLEQWMDIFASR